MFHYLYKTTCSITSEYYIGIHSTSKIDDGYLGSGVLLKQSVKKHGKINHSKEILEFFGSRKSLLKREKEIVTVNFIANKNCLNVALGGGSYLLEQYNPKSAKLGGDTFSKMRKQDSFLDKNYKENLSKAILKARSEGKMKTWKTTFSWLGKSHSAETKRKMSNSKKGKGKHEKNSQFQTCWITKDKINKKIKLDKLEIFLSEGWQRGRFRMSLDNGQVPDRVTE